MSDWPDALNAASAAALRLAAAVVVQSTLVAVAVALVCALWRRVAPAVRCWLWRAVALKLLVMPFWTVALSWPVAAVPVEKPVSVRAGPFVPLPIVEPAPVVGVAQPQAAEVARPVRSVWRELSVPSWLLMAWVLGVVVLVARLLIQRRRLTALLRRTAPAEWELDAVVGALAGELGLRRGPRVMVCDGAGSPFVCGLGRPTLVLPRATLAALTPAQLRQVLLHELAHLGRRDLFWGWLPELARLVWWFHPVAHWAAAQARLERELACDQVALAHSGGRAADYAETLVRVVAPGAARG